MPNCDSSSAIADMDRVLAAVRRVPKHVISRPTKVATRSGHGHGHEGVPDAFPQSIHVDEAPPIYRHIGTAMGSCAALSVANNTHSELLNFFIFLYIFLLGLLLL